MLWNSYRKFGFLIAIVVFAVGVFIEHRRTIVLGVGVITWEVVRWRIYYGF